MSLKDENEKKVTEAYVQMRREATRERLALIYLPYYDALCEALEGTYWAPYSGRRSAQEQNAMYAKGRTPESIKKNERRVTDARAGFSPHNYGCATDWAEFRPEFRGTSVWDKANWQQFGDAVQKVGLVWGESWNDSPHCELPLKDGISWKDIGSIYVLGGGLEAFEAVERKYGILFDQKRGIIS